VATDGLKSRLGGSLITPHSADYDEVRQIWNAMIDRRPGLIVRCAGTADVLACVRFARDHRLLTSIRGAGHNIAGNALCDGGLMIDLSAMKSVRVDPWNRTARVEPGATLADFDREVQAFGLATPLGINSTTGVAGLTLGGGFSWLSRKHGMTIDNLVAADVVTAASSPDELVCWVVLRKAPPLPFFIGQVGGASKRVAGNATAYPHRDAEFVMNVHTRWDDPGEDQRCVAWAREFFNATAPHATGGVYVNFITEDEERVPSAYGGNFDRIAEIKRRYDPDNLFRLNQNIQVKAAA
jgi:FAD/FMN-containing dehydrogenase